MGYILVNYSVVTGEWGAESVRSFSLNGRESVDVIDDYFSGFWEQDTITKSKGKLYHHQSWEQAVKIGLVRPITKEEYEVLERLGI